MTVAADSMHPEQIAVLQRRAESLRARAEQITDAYNRSTWYRFTAVFFPIPFVLVLMRLQVDYWHYYIFGSAYILLAAALYIYDGRASERCAAAHKEADAARQALERARGA